MLGTGNIVVKKAELVPARMEIANWQYLIMKMFMLFDLKIPLQETHAKGIINKMVKYLYTKIFIGVLLSQKMETT